MTLKNSFQSKKILNVDSKSIHYFSLPDFAAAVNLKLDRLPFSIRVLLENLIRNENGLSVTREQILKAVNYNPEKVEPIEIPFMPTRVVLQDFTGVPAVVDIAAIRDAVKKFGKDPSKINPLVRSDLVVDHSVQVDFYGSHDAFHQNVELEYQRNNERYSLLKWAQKSFENFSVVPPDTGIIHQVNLEFLADVVNTKDYNGTPVAHFDTLVGTDSHTTMINGLSVLGWGVGGIEAEAVMLGQPYYMLLPEVVGVHLYGKLPEGSTATDLVLTVTEKLRKLGVVGKFVEYFGEGLDVLALPDRATLANMAPEYGATMGFFPIDDSTLDYLKLTGRSEEQIELVKSFAEAQGMFRTSQTPNPSYSTVLEMDMSTVVPSLAGPKRPQDRVELSSMKNEFMQTLRRPITERGFALSEKELSKKAVAEFNHSQFELEHGSVVLAAITSCTNTSNPAVLIAAGLVAKKANQKGLKQKPWVKTSLAPGSRVVTEYLQQSNLLSELEQLGFHVVGYGCTTCIGNSGPLPESIETAFKEQDLVVASVLSGNRNFEGRVHQSIKANYLASPPLVVAYALTGKTTIDFAKEPIGTDNTGKPVYLKDIWPTHEEVSSVIHQILERKMFRKNYENVYDGDQHWQSLKATESDTYAWEEASTYVKLPPFFVDMPLEVPEFQRIENARALAVLGDSVTTDHISPAGTIAPDSPAGRYLKEHGVEQKDFNSYGSRRGNHEVMMRGTFANIRIKNQLAPGTEGGFTTYLPSGEQMSIYDAAMKYKEQNIPLVIIAGKEYGTGSSRDWAAKGTQLLGVKAVMAESFERIHRSNLVGMGVLPLQFKPGENKASLGLTGNETFSFEGIDKDVEVGKEITVTARSDEGNEKRFQMIMRLDTPFDIEYYKNGGILQTVLRQISR